MTSNLSIKDYFRGKKIVITGGTGYLGKILVEKFLRSCSDLDTVFLIVRSKKGLSIQERWEKITNLPLFDKIRAECPEVLKKVHLIEGNMEQYGLNLSEADKEILIENVDIIYHNAAAVQFTNDFNFSLLHNTKATYNMAEFALSLKHLKLFVHVSTDYCNSNIESRTVEEKIYPAPMKWKNVLDNLEENPYELAVFGEKILSGHKTTYTFSKLLSEHVMNDYSKQFPVLIIRPSIIIGVYEDPLPGWSDMLNGASSVILVGGYGIVRAAKCMIDIPLDYISADHCVKTIISSTWLHGTKNETKGTEIISCNYGHELTISMKKIWDQRHVMLKTLCSKFMVWYPFMVFASNEFLFRIVYLIFQVLPSLLLDWVLKAAGKRPMFVAISKKFLLLSDVGYKITETDKIYLNGNLKKLLDFLKKQNEDDFFFKWSDIDVIDLFLLNAQGTVKYFLKENISDDNLAERNKRLTRMRYLHYTVCTILAAFSGYILYKLVCANLYVREF